MENTAKYTGLQKKKGAMGSDQRMLVEETSKKQTEHFVCENNVNSTPFQHIYRGNATGFVGVYKGENGKFGASIKDPVTKKSVWLGIFNTAEEASNAYLLKKQEFLDTHQSVKKPSIGLLGIRRRKSGRYAAVITDPIRHKEVWLGTFDTVEEASQAYLSKKSEFEKLVKVNQGEKPIICVESSEEASCLMANVHDTKNCDQFQPVGASVSVDNDQTSNVASVGSKKAFDSQGTKHFVGVRKRNSGRYACEIHDPISKKTLYLGTFDTAEEASQAVQSKKLEIQKLVKAKQQYNRQTHSCARAKQDGKEKLVNVKQGQKTVDLEGFQLESACGASLLDIEVPILNSFNGGSEQRIESHEISHSRGLQMRNSGKCTTEILLGTLGTAEETGFQISEKAALQSDMPTDSSAGENQEGEEDEDLWMGKWVQLPGNKEINYSLKLGVPIIDNYGSLLGEFRSLDDLRIVKH